MRQMGINLISKKGILYVRIAYCMTIIINFVFCGFLVVVFFFKVVFQNKPLLLPTGHSAQQSVHSAGSHGLVLQLAK